MKMEQPRKIYLISGLFGGLVALVVVLVSAFVTEKKPSHKENQQYLEHIRETYRIYSLPLPTEAFFCGEAVPLEDADVAERFDRELLVNSYWHSNTLLSIKRSRRWFPVIEPILKANEIPDDFKYLALIESGFTNAVSPSGAVGFWQFLPETAKQYNLEVNDEVDERYNVERSTEAACKYLREAYNKFGNWALVAASYNMGMGGVSKQTDRQNQRNYFDLLLNEETSRYVFRILAIKEIINNADRYGFVIRPADLYQPYQFKTVVVDTALTDLVAFARNYNLTYKDLKIYNPWLRQNYLTNKAKKSYEIKLKE